MPEHLQSVLYTAPPVVEGGREGYGPSLDGWRVVDLSVPESMGGSAEPGNNPEELFAVGFAPELQGPFLTREQGVDLMAGPATGRGEAA